MVLMRRFLFVSRLFMALAMAMSSPVVEIAHGAAHEHTSHHHELDVEATPHSRGIESADDHGSAHRHNRVEEALKVAGPSSIAVPPPGQSVEIPLIVATLLPVDSGPRYFIGSDSGPPPSLRAPPIA